MRNIGDDLDARKGISGTVAERSVIATSARSAIAGREVFCCNQAGQLLHYWCCNRRCSVSSEREREPEVT